MWKSTEIMAKAICEGLCAGGSVAEFMPLGVYNRSDVATNILDAGALIVGSPTLNNNMFPTVADMLTYLQGLKPKSLIGAAFGSFGWSGESVSLIERMLIDMKVRLIGEGIKVKYVPEFADLKECYSLGMDIAARLKESG